MAAWMLTSLLVATVLAYSATSVLEGPVASNHSGQAEGPNDPIVLPDTFVPRCDARDPHCFQVHNYPSEAELDTLLQNVPPRYKDYMYNDPADNDTADQAGGNWTQACSGQVSYVVLQAAKTSVAQEHLLVVNSKRYRQLVRTETCSEVGAVCGNLDLMLYSTECRQMYSQRKLLALDKHTGTPVMQSFDIPSACKCFYKLITSGPRAWESPSRLAHPRNQRQRPLKTASQTAEAVSAVES